MTRRFAVVVLGFAALAGTSVLIASGLQTPDKSTVPVSGLEVHEWGTFTSVAGADGQAVPWSPLSGPSDLPCFVQMLAPDGVKYSLDWLSAVRATVRMETPVVYFYSSEPRTVQVDVRFPQGLITEWYPKATVPRAPLPVDFGAVVGTASWRDVEVRPGAPDTFLTEARKSHYYTARDTDAAPLRVSGQDEKFLFYRGLASFPVALAATVAPDGAIEVTNTGPAIGTVIVFESDGRRVGYRNAGAVDGVVRLTRPALTGSLSALSADLERVLVAEGMFPREAAAMVETWRDSWFERGTRLLYVVPRSTVDAVLPLSITPAPTKVARAFVGRLELLTPESLAEVSRALTSRDMRTLATFGRFLEPMAGLVTPSLQAGTDVKALLQDAALWHRTDQPSCR